MTKCQPGCACKRHKRVLTDEHRANIAKANAARRGESHKCPEGCTCNRHKVYYRGGSKKGRQLSQAARDRIAEAALNRQYSDEDRQRLADQMRANRSDPEWERKRIDAMRAAMRGLSSGQVSRPEYVLVPYLFALGYTHNSDGAVRIGRKIPDFVDVAGKRVFEYFGNRFHQPHEEQERIDYFQSLGWECKVLWGHDMVNWVARHKELVTDEEHRAAWRVARMNNESRTGEA